MQTDTYTKSVLTVIAVCLCLLTIQQIGLIPTANASGSRVLPLGNISLLPVDVDGEVKVRLMNNSKVDVNITGIRTYDELSINLDEIGGYSVGSGDPIRVKVEE